MEESIKWFEKASMPLQELASNSHWTNDIIKVKGIFTKSDQSLKTLGYQWNFSIDTWRIEVPDFILSDASKRAIHSNISTMYDSLGLMMPPVLQKKKTLIKNCW